MALNSRVANRGDVDEEPSSGTIPNTCVRCGATTFQRNEHNATMDRHRVDLPGIPGVEPVQDWKNIVEDNESCDPWECIEGHPVTQDQEEALDFLAVEGVWPTMVEAGLA